MANEREEFRTVNALLGAKPMLGPLSADQILPWTVIAGIALVIGQVFQLDWHITGTLAAWGITTWWILVGNTPWRFLSKFQKTPTWGRGYVSYRSLRDVERQRSQCTKRTRKL